MSWTTWGIYRYIISNGGGAQMPSFDCRAACLVAAEEELQLDTRQMFRRIGLVPALAEAYQQYHQQRQSQSGGLPAAPMAMQQQAQGKQQLQQRVSGQQQMRPPQQQQSQQHSNSMQRTQQ